MLTPLELTPLELTPDSVRPERPAGGVSPSLGEGEAGGGGGGGGGEEGAGLLTGGEGRLPGLVVVRASH